MPASAFMPDVTVEIAFASQPNDPSPVWTDVSAYVEAVSPISISRGRSDELAEVQPSKLTVTLDNTDKRFTPGNTTGAYYPNVKKDRRIRVSAVWPLGGGGTTYRRFSGYIDEWPVVWPSGTAEYASVTVTASSRLARLAAGYELRSIIEEEYLLDKPTADYPLGEPQPVGTGQAADVSGNQQTNLVAAGTGLGIQWQQATGPGTDGLSAPNFQGGKYLETVLAGVVQTSITLEMFINTTDVPAGGVQNGLSHCNRLSLNMTSSGFIQATGQADTVNPSSNPTTVNDGATHHVAYRETTSGGTVTGTLFIDGTQVATASGTLNNPVPSTPLLRVGRSRFLDGLTEAWQGVIAHAAVFSGATQLSNSRIAEHSASGLTGFAGDSSDEWITRLATHYGGVPSAEVSTEAGLTTSIAAQESTGQTVLELMNKVTDTENGLLFDAGNGTLTFHARSHRYNTALAFTLDAAQDQVEASLEARLDGQQLVNDVTATRTGGDSQVRVVNTTSRDEHGVKRETLELLTSSDNELLDAANWKVQRYGEPDIRIQTVTVDLINQSSSLVTSLLAAELGTRIRLSNLPAQAPASSMDGFIEGIDEALGAESYTITFQLSPVLQSDVWQLDSASYSQLGTTTVLAY